MNQLAQNTKPSWWSDKLNRTKAIIGVPLLAGAAYLFGTYVLPFLVKMVWDTVSLVIGGVVLFFLIAILTSPRFWRVMNYIYGLILKNTLGFITEFDPFIILETQLREKEKDREKLRLQSEKLKGKKQELGFKIQEQQEAMITNMDKAKIAREKRNESAAILSTNAVTRAKTYIDKITPIFNDLDKLITFSDKAYQLSGDAILNAKEDLKMQKDLYYSVTTGNSAISAAMKAFRGDAGMNEDAEFALEKLKENIGIQIGQIQSAINITNQFMDAAELEDAAKTARTMRMIEGFDTNSAFSYIPVENTEKQFLGNVSVTKGNKYSSLLLDEPVKN